METKHKRSNQRKRENKDSKAQNKGVMREHKDRRKQAQHYWDFFPHHVSRSRLIFWLKDPNLTCIFYFLVVVSQKLHITTRKTFASVPVCMLVYTVSPLYMKTRG